MAIDYSAYISSEVWRQKRLEILERDRHQCQTCLSCEDLEVHHKTYERLGNEDSYDLITLCHECHEAITDIIRRRRYSKRTIEITDTVNGYYTRTSVEVTHGRTAIEIQDYGDIRPNRPQWADSRPHEQICKSDETNFLETLQNRRGLRGDGET